MTDSPVLLDLDARGVATATLNRPERGNAYDEALLHALIEGVRRLRADASVRARRTGTMAVLRASTPSP